MPGPADHSPPAAEAQGPPVSPSELVPDQSALVLADEQQRVDTSKIIYTLLEEARLRGRRIRRRIKYSVLSLGLLLHLFGWFATWSPQRFRLAQRTSISIVLVSIAVMLLAVLPNERIVIGFTALLSFILQVTGIASSSVGVHQIVVNIRAARALRASGGVPADAPVNPARDYVAPDDIWIRELTVVFYCACAIVFGIAALFLVRSVVKHRCTRHTLETVWSTLGTVVITFSIYALFESIVIPVYLTGRVQPVDPANTVVILVSIVLGVGMLSARARARLMGWVAARCESSSVAAHMAMLMGGGSADVMRNATSRLRAVSAELLKPTDLAGELVARDVFLRSRPAHIGEIDAFISHSWRADPKKKWEVLSRWCDDFRAENGRMPLLWIDRLCIDPDDPAMAVGCLPVFVSACNSLVILFEPTFITRLWCLVEVFAYLTMHQDMGSHVRITVLDITKPPTPPSSPRMPRASADGASSRSAEARVESSWQRRMRNTRTRQSGRIRPVELEPIPSAAEVAPATQNAQELRPMTVEVAPVTNIAQVLRPMTIESFDVRQAVCTYEADTVYLQDLIDAYPGGIILFNRKVRDLLAKVDRGAFVGTSTSHRIEHLARGAALVADHAAAADHGVELEDKAEPHHSGDLKPQSTREERLSSRP